MTARPTALLVLLNLATAGGWAMTAPTKTEVDAALALVTPMPAGHSRLWVDLRGNIGIEPGHKLVAVAQHGQALVLDLAPDDRASGAPAEECGKSIRENGPDALTLCFTGLNLYRELNP